MTIPFLKTKLYIPPVRPDLVSRPRLIERIDEGIRSGHKLTLVSAPAGFGKTTVVSDWLRHVESSMRVAWLLLDKEDNDPARFLAYLLAAFQQVEPNVGHAAQDMLQSSQPPPIESLMTVLINELATLPTRLCLVLDDYHFITAPTIHNALAFLLDHMPQNVYLVVLTRADPPFPLSRLRARGQVSEIRTDDLRFTVTEAAAFLNKRPRSTVSDC